MQPNKSVMTVDQDITRVRFIVLLTKYLASAYVVAQIGKGLINAAMKIGGFN